MSFRSFRSRPRARLLLIPGVLAVVGGGWYVLLRRAETRHPLLTAPTLALEHVPAGALYYNGPARPWLAAQRPELLSADDTDERSERARRFAQAVQSPKLFRQLDRQNRFETLLLMGDPSLYRPLLEHLLETRDWTLAYLDHTSLIYRRGGEGPGWSAEALRQGKERFTDHGDQALFLAQAALKLLAVRRNSEALAALEEALALNDRLPDAWNGMAIYRMNRGEWPLALSKVDRALELDRNFLPATATKAQILYATKKFSEAYELSRTLIEAFPDDPGLLFYHAKISHEAHAYTDEIRTLQRLIGRAEAENQPQTGYRLYLAQALAADGQATPAMAEFTRVLADPNISEPERKFASEILAQIKTRTGSR